MLATLPVRTSAPPPSLMALDLAGATATQLRDGVRPCASPATRARVPTHPPPRLCCPLPPTPPHHCRKHIPPLKALQLPRQGGYLPFAPFFSGLRSWPEWLGYPPGSRPTLAKATERRGNCKAAAAAFWRAAGGAATAMRHEATAAAAAAAAAAGGAGAGATRGAPSGAMGDGVQEDGAPSAMDADALLRVPPGAPRDLPSCGVGRDVGSSGRCCNGRQPPPPC
jgi:hypothetical protein